MNTRHTTALAAVTIAVLGLTACSSDNDDDAAGGNDSTSEPAPGGGTATEDDYGYGAPPPPAPEEGAGEGASGVLLRLADTDLGTIVVDGEGMTVYQFDSDEQGAGSSTCDGQCAQLWPAVPGDDAPELDGVTGEVGTIAGVDDEPQLTLDGWPLYYYVGDAAPGDTSGQGVGDVWWVLTPAGEPVRN